MTSFKPLIMAALFSIVASTIAFAVDSKKTTVIYEDSAAEIAKPPAAFNADGDLWVTLNDLTRATKFVLKPKGVCRDELCYPIPKNRKTAFLRRESKTTWFNLSEFARLLRQPVAHDAETSVWYFGPRQDVQNAFVASLTAPDFTLPDRQGKPHSLRDFRGKKVLLLTWASW